jgi:hypothetical protein
MHRSCVEFIVSDTRIVAEEGEDRDHGLLGRAAHPTFPIADAQPGIARCVSDLLLAPAEFEAAFLEVLADGLWAHLRPTLQRPTME